MPPDTIDSAPARASLCNACGDTLPPDAWTCRSCGAVVLAETGLPANGATQHGRRRRSRTRRSGSAAPKPAPSRTVKLRMTTAGATMAVLGVISLVIAAFLLGMTLGRW